LMSAATACISPLGDCWDLATHWLIVFIRNTGSFTLFFIIGHNYLINRLRLPLCCFDSCIFELKSFSLSFSSYTSFLFSVFNCFIFSIYFFSFSNYLLIIIYYSESLLADTLAVLFKLFPPLGPFALLAPLEILLAECPLVLELLLLFIFCPNVN
jgi:hypothetical protein